MANNGKIHRPLGKQILLGLGISLAIFLVTGITSPTNSVEPSEILADPAKEAQARELSKELRCLVCRNQSIDDSDAPLARDLRIFVRERLQQGAELKTIKNEIVARYGDYVLLTPPFNWQSVILWVAPFLVFILALILGFMGLRWVQSEHNPPPPLTLSEKVRLEGLLRHHDREERHQNQQNKVEP